MSISSSVARRVMRRAALACVVVATPLAAQENGVRRLTAEDLGGVIVAVHVPADDPQVDANARRLLATRLTTVLTTAGIAGVGSAAPFAIYPVTAIVDERTVDVGLRPQTVVTLELAFVVGHVASSSAIHQWTGRFTGTATTRSGAISQAITSLSPANPALREFGVETRRRIVEYYERSCDAIRGQARVAADAGRTNEGLAELLAVPTEASACHAAATRDAEAILAPRESSQGKVRSGRTQRTQRVALSDDARREAAEYFNNSASKNVRFKFVRR